MIGRAYIATFRAIFSDTTALMLIVGSCILYSFFYPTAYSGEVPVRMPVAIVDLDHSAASRALQTRVDASQQAAIVARVSNSAEAMHLLERREVSAFVLIPEGFERAILRGEQGKVALYGNGAFLLRSSTALSGVASALGVVGREAATAQAMASGAPAVAPLAIVQRPLFNTREGYGSTVVPGVVFLIIQQTLLMGLATIAATMREQYGRLGLPPQTLLGIALAFFTIGCAHILYFTGFVFWFQDYPRAAAAPLTLIVAGAMFIAATVAGALMIGSFFRTRERPTQLWIVTSVPIFFLSGLNWPAEATPEWLLWLARLLPTTPGIKLMVGVNQMGASLSDQRFELLNLALLAIFYGAIALWRFREKAGVFPAQVPASRP